MLSFLKNFNIKTTFYNPFSFIFLLTDSGEYNFHLAHLVSNDINSVTNFLCSQFQLAKFKNGAM